MKNNNGASLTILSVIIIILIILAGVSFAMLVGDNGIFISKSTEMTNNAKEEIDSALEAIQKEATKKVKENKNLLEVYSTVDLKKYGLDTEEGYKLIDKEGKETTGILEDGVIIIKYENIKAKKSVIGQIDFKIEGEEHTTDAIYGTIEKAHEK